MGGRAEGLGARIAPHRLSRAAGTADNIASRSNCRRWNRVIMCCCSSPSERGHTQQEAELELQHLVMTSTSVVGANRSHFSNSSLGTVSVLSHAKSSHAASPQSFQGAISCNAPFGDELGTGPSPTKFSMGGGECHQTPSRHSASPTAPMYRAPTAFRRQRPIAPLVAYPTTLDHMATTHPSSNAARE